MDEPDGRGEVQHDKNRLNEAKPFHRAGLDDEKVAVDFFPMMGESICQNVISQIYWKIS